MPALYHPVPLTVLPSFTNKMPTMSPHCLLQILSLSPTASVTLLPTLLPQWLHSLNILLPCCFLRLVQGVTPLLAQHVALGPLPVHYTYSPCSSITSAQVSLLSSKLTYLDSPAISTSLGWCTVICPWWKCPPLPSLVTNLPSIIAPICVDWQHYVHGAKDRRQESSLSMDSLHHSHFQFFTSAFYFYLLNISFLIPLINTFPFPFW